MKPFITLLALVAFTATASYQDPNGEENKPASGEKVIVRVKSPQAKDTTLSKKKDEKSFKETIRFLLLGFEKK